MADLPERALLDDARSGDADALERLLEQYQRRVYRFGLKMCRDPEDASDVLQETLFAASRTLGKFEGRSSVSTWLYAIARSFCIKKRRRSRFAPAKELSLEDEAAQEASQLVHHGPGPDEQLAQRRLRDALERAIGGLDHGQREVLVLRDVEGLTAAEVAEVTGLSEQAVKSRLHRARVALRTALGPELDVEPAPVAGNGCPRIAPLFSRHLEGEIGPAVCARMERHLAECPRCRQTCDSLREVLRTCRSSPLPEVPTSVQDVIRTRIRKFLLDNG